MGALKVEDEIYQEMITPIECEHEDGSVHTVLPDKPERRKFIHRWVMTTTFVMAESEIQKAIHAARENGEFWVDDDMGKFLGSVFMCHDCMLDWPTYQTVSQIIKEDPRYIEWKTRMVMMGNERGEITGVPCHPMVKSMCREIINQPDEVKEEAIRRRKARYNN